MWKIYAPVKDATGTWATVRFVNGVGETKNPALVEWFRQHGYRVEENLRIDSLENPQAILPPTDEHEFVNINETADTTQPDFDSMTPNELREWMKANGLGREIKNIRNKEKLLEIIRG